MFDKKHLNLCVIEFTDSVLAFVMQEAEDSPFKLSDKQRLVRLLGVLSGIVETWPWCASIPADFQVTEEIWKNMVNVYDNVYLPWVLDRGEWHHTVRRRAVELSVILHDIESWFPQSLEPNWYEVSEIPATADKEEDDESWF